MKRRTSLYGAFLLACALVGVGASPKAQSGAPAQPAALGDTIRVHGATHPLSGVTVTQVSRSATGVAAAFRLPATVTPDLDAALKQPTLHIIEDKANAGLFWVANVGSVEFAAPDPAAVAALPPHPLQNLSDATVRRDVSRVRSDMRSLSTALESFNIDNSFYPQSVPGNHPDSISNGSPSLATRPTLSAKTPVSGGSAHHNLTTPISYIERMPADPFSPDDDGRTTFSYFSDGKGYIIVSPGPDEQFDFDPAALFRHDPASAGNIPAAIIPFVYDPSNGIVSAGDIVRVNY